MLCLSQLWDSRMTFWGVILWNRTLQDNEALISQVLMDNQNLNAAQRRETGLTAKGEKA